HGLARDHGPRRARRGPAAPARLNGVGVADLVAGVDGCRAGWVVVLTHSACANGSVATAEVTIARDFRGVLELTRQARVVGVDMPIGLLDAAVRGGRECDRHARRLLGRGPPPSAFSPPPPAPLLPPPPSPPP